MESVVVRDLPSSELFGVGSFTASMQAVSHRYMPNHIQRVLSTKVEPIEMQQAHPLKQQSHTPLS